VAGARDGKTPEAQAPGPPDPETPASKAPDAETPKAGAPEPGASDTGAPDAGASKSATSAPESADLSQDGGSADLTQDERAELEHLRAEVADLHSREANLSDRETDLQTREAELRGQEAAVIAGARRRRGGWRAPVSAVLIVIGCVLAPISVVGVWTANQVSDTNR